MKIAVLDPFHREPLRVPLPPGIRDDEGWPAEVSLVSGGVVRIFKPVEGMADVVEGVDELRHYSFSHYHYEWRKP